MAHYAWIDNTNKVINVTVGVDETITQDGVGGSTEAWETFYTEAINQEGVYVKRTSFNNNIRANFAGIGYKYDSDFDIFIPPQPYPSWKLDYTTYSWEAPVAKPDEVEGFRWKWSEINKEWIQIAKPTE
jgi:hypothetical protein